MQHSCHIILRNISLYGRAGNPVMKCASHLVSADLAGLALGPTDRWVSFASYARKGMRQIRKGRSTETALTDRRRQSCRSQLNRFWPSAFSLCSQLASRKSLWKSQWSWKKRPCPSSKDSGSAISRPNPFPSTICLLHLKYSWRLACSPSASLVFNKKMFSWSSVVFPKKDNSFVAVARPFASSFCKAGNVAC